MTNPQYPVGIVSKGRADTMFTSRSLARIRVPHYIVIEPQDEKAYEDALDKFDIRDYVTLIVAPFSNHGDGPGRARNYFWDFTQYDLGTKYHWVLDDNIQDFYRLHKNKRIRVGSGSLFRACEDFTDRFENVPLSGLQYRFFIAPDSYRPPYTLNTRIYSTLLIRNDCKHRWRGRYNEDTDLSLRVLKDGDCTIQYNVLLQGKVATQTLGGGNTEEFYHAEGVKDKSKWRDGSMNSTGTINKSQMLVDMHPDVSKMVWRYGRWHHHVDYSKFQRNNKLRYREGFDRSKLPKVNNYGLKLMVGYGTDNEKIIEG